MASENFKSTVDSLFSGMDSFLSTKTVVGEPINIGEVTIVPLVDVSFGIGAGACDKREERSPMNYGAGGMGGKLSPSAVLVIHNGVTRLVNIKNSTGFDKILDMIPDFVEKFQDWIGKGKKDDEGRKAAGEALEETIMEAAKVGED